MSRFDTQPSDEKLQKFGGSLRVMGWGFFIIGCAIFLFFFYLAIDPSQTITINGVIRTDFKSKIIGAFLAPIVPLIAGSLMAFGPPTKIQSYLRWWLKQNHIRNEKKK